MNSCLINISSFSSSLISSMGFMVYNISEDSSLKMGFSSKKQISDKGGGNNNKTRV